MAAKERTEDLPFSPCSDIIVLHDTNLQHICLLDVILTLLFQAVQIALKLMRNMLKNYAGGDRI